MRFTFLVLPAAALILIAGCSGSGSGRHSGATPSVSAVPTDPATTSASDSPTPSPTGTTPLLTGADVKPGEVPPTEDRRFVTDDQGGAISFASYFYEALDWSIATTNANLLRAISAPTCTGCQGYIQELDKLAAEGAHTEGARLVATQFAPSSGTLVQAQYVIKVTFTQGQLTLVQSDGSRSPYPAPPNPGVNYLYVDWQNGSWIAVEVSHQA